MRGQLVKMHARNLTSNSPPFAEADAKTEVPRRPQFGRDRVESGPDADVAEIDADDIERAPCGKSLCDANLR